MSTFFDYITTRKLPNVQRTLVMGLSDKDTQFSQEEVQQAYWNTVMQFPEEIREKITNINNILKALSNPNNSVDINNKLVRELRESMFVLSDTVSNLNQPISFEIKNGVLCSSYIFKGNRLVFNSTTNNLLGIEKVNTTWFNGQESLKDNRYQALISFIYDAEGKPIFKEGNMTSVFNATYSSESGAKIMGDNFLLSEGSLMDNVRLTTTNVEGVFILTSSKLKRNPKYDPVIDSQNHGYDYDYDFPVPHIKDDNSPTLSAMVKFENGRIKILNDSVFYNSLNVSNASGNTLCLNEVSQKQEDLQEMQKICNAYEQVLMHNMKLMSQNFGLVQGAEELGYDLSKYSLDKTM